MKPTVKNNKKAKHVVERPAKEIVLPPALADSTLKAPKQFETIGDIIREQQRLYKLVFSGELALTDLTKLMYSLQQIIQGLRVKSEMDALEEAYIKQWQGVRFIAPEDMPQQDPHDAIIEGEAVRDE